MFALLGSIHWSVTGETEGGREKGGERQHWPAARLKLIMLWERGTSFDQLFHGEPTIYFFTKKHCVKFMFRERLHVTEHNIIWTVWWMCRWMVFSVCGRVAGIWLLLFEEGSHSLWHLLPVVKPSCSLSSVKLIPPVVSSIGLNYFLFLSESRLWGAARWHRGAVSWLEETSSLYRDLHGRKLIHWFRCCLVMLMNTT